MCSKRKDSDFNEKQIQRFIDAVICDLCAGLVKSFFAWFCILHSCIHVRSTSPSGTVVTTSMSHVPTFQRYVVPRDVDCVELFITVITVITVTVDISKVPQLSQVPQFPHSFWLEADVAAPPPSTKRGVKASASMERQEKTQLFGTSVGPLGFLLDPCADNKRLRLTKRLTFAKSWFEPCEESCFFKQDVLLEDGRDLFLQAVE